MDPNPEDWIGSTHYQRDEITPALIERYKSVLGGASDGETAPLGLHWCLCLPTSPMMDLGSDGHPRTGGFLPASALPRRMWASSDVEFLRPLKEEVAVERFSTVKRTSEKNGRSGKLLFVEVEHKTMSREKECLNELQTIVYREASKKILNLPKPQDHDLSDWEFVERIHPTTALLFRYSALTFNSHRIHYDLPYAKDQERYPALVVHGPLMASLLLRFVTGLKHGRRLKRFRFRGLAPAFCDQPLSLVAKDNSSGFDLGVIGCDGATVMSAEAELK